MRNKITLQQIANEVGTSKVTVSRALNNKPGLSDDMRKKILTCAGNHSYNLKQKRAIGLLAFLVPERFFLESDRFYTAIYLNLSNLCQEQNIMLNAITYSYEQEKKSKIPELFFRQQFDGVFVAGECSEPFVDTLSATGLPLVFIDFVRHDEESSCVLANNFELGYEAASFLIKNGHRHIGFAGDYKNNQNLCSRYLGLQKALIMHDLKFDSTCNIINNDFNTGLYTLNYALPDKMPTAFVCSCDMVAFYLYEKLKMMNYRIPQDISIISFDNTDICCKMSPSLTSIDINKQDFARIAYNLMCTQDNAQMLPKKLFVDTKLFIRDSVIAI